MKRFLMVNIFFLGKILIRCLKTKNPKVKHLKPKKQKNVDAQFRGLESKVTVHPG